MNDPLLKQSCIILSDQSESGIYRQHYNDPVSIHIHKYPLCLPALTETFILIKHVLAIYWVESEAEKQYSVVWMSKFHYYTQTITHKPVLTN